LDSAIADEVAAGRIDPNFRHVIAFSADETGRAARDSSYTTSARRPWYPLIEQGRTRAWCGAYLKKVLNGFVYPRSCCVFCCFQAPRKGRAALARRWSREPTAGAYALRLEHRALTLNRKMRLFGSLSAAELPEWTVVETRRVYRPASVKDPATGKSVRGRDGWTVQDPTMKGDTWRSIRAHTVAAARDEGLAVLAQLAIEHDTVVWTGFDQVLRVDVRAMPTQPRQWPITTHEYALVPGTIQAKEHNGVRPGVRCRPGVG
jgi:hypothetical protein